MKKLVGTVILGCLMFAMPSYASEATPSEIIEKNSYDVPELTGDWLTDIFAVAWSQEGYTEDDYGNTKYSDWAGQHGRPWCSEFVSWCADQAEIPKNVIPKAASSTAFRNFYSSKGRFYLLDNGRNHEECGCKKASSGVLTLDELRKGDILLIESNDDFSDGADHTELLEYVSNGVLYTFGGNINDMVRKNDQQPEEIHGVCRPDYEGIDLDYEEDSSSGGGGGSSSGGGGSSSGGGFGSGGSGATGITGPVIAGNGPGTTGITTVGTHAYGGTWEWNGEHWKLRMFNSQYAASRWALVEGKWYLFDSQSNMLTGWQIADGKWYYMNPDGSMATGWCFENGKWYYLNGDGSMATGWININGKYYCLATDGVLYVNTYTPDGYYVNTNGELVG